MTQQNATTEVTIQYINLREGNRPATIKTTNNEYYTISDSSSAMFEQGDAGQLTFFTNPKGYKVATAWKGAALPKDSQRSAPVGNVVQMTQPATAPATPAAPTAIKKRVDVPPAIAGIIKSCIETGLTREEAAGWVALGLKGKEALGETQAPPTVQHLDAPDVDDAIPF